MKIEQFRDALEKTAMMHGRLGASESASALRALASVLKVRDKVTVERFVADVKKLRTTESARVQQTRESA
jgi:hypothetical protein